MSTSKNAQMTDFSKDVLGRYLCNGLDEALQSADKSAPRADGSAQNDARPFDIIIVGGGSFGGTLAQHLLYAFQLIAEHAAIGRAARIHGASQRWVSRSGSSASVFHAVATASSRVAWSA